MDWIYLSPHLDDAAFSCGGLIWEQAQASAAAQSGVAAQASVAARAGIAAGEKVAIWTICAGDPPGRLSSLAETLHARWGIPSNSGGEAIARRREEDLRACRLLGATPRHFPIPDCIYRSQEGVWLYDSEEDIFGALHPAEAVLVQDLSTTLAQMVPPGANLVSPLTVGGHADHRLVRQAAELLDRDLWYYADYPYVVRGASSPREPNPNLVSVPFSISEEGLQAWEQGIAAYASQVGSFWEDTAAMRAGLHAYLEHQGGGIRLWRR
jgi:LmbE family N-acetylglucosaminyl deacetylase